MDASSQNISTKSNRLTQHIIPTFRCLYRYRPISLELMGFFIFHPYLTPIGTDQKFHFFTSYEPLEINYTINNYTPCISQCLHAHVLLLDRSNCCYYCFTVALAERFWDFHHGRFQYYFSFEAYFLQFIHMCVLAVTFY